jgi:hypothetical protein
VSKTLALRYALGEMLAEDGSWVPSDHAAIIDRETWERAARLREATSRTGRGRRTESGLIFRKGYLVCGCCGGSMVPRSSEHRYFCMRNKMQGPGTCPMPSVSSKAIDRAVLDYFERTWLDVDGTRERLAASFTAWSDEAASYLAEAERDAQRARERLDRVKRDYQDGKLDADDWNDQRVELREELRAAEAQVEVMRGREAQVAADTAQRDVEAETLRTLAALREAANVDHVRAVLQTVFERFVLEIEPEAAKRIKRFPDARSRSLLLAEHGGLVIRPCLRPDVVERTAAGYSADKVALPAKANNAYASLPT